MKNRKTLIQPYTKTWITDFKKIKEVIYEKVSNKKFVIEHVGSTSVPQLDSKPIIDIDIIYQEDSDFLILIEKLVLLGYYHNGDQGITGREVFKRDENILTHRVLDSITHHLYVCHINSKELKRHLLFRDELRTNKSARDTYAKLKYEVADEANQDQKLYAEIKEIKARKFVEGLILRTKNK